MWSDNETEVDFLGFQHLTAAISSIVKRDDLLPATIGVYGDWGGGKSSLLKMAAAELKKDKGVFVVDFNGWTFEGFEDAKSALMGSILDALEDEKKIIPEALGAFKKLAKRVNWLRTAGGVAKLAVGVATGEPLSLVSGAGDMMALGKDLLDKAQDVDADDLKEYLTEGGAAETRRSVREFRKDFKELLDATKIKKLVVVIDDLDRCLPDTVIATLEAIKLFLFVPGTVFILGADERLVKHAVRRRFPELPGERAEVGRDYLEKLIQYPIKVPPLGPAEMIQYVNLLYFKEAGATKEQIESACEVVKKVDSTNLYGVRFGYDAAAKILKDETKKDALREALAVAEQVAPLLASGLSGNPRQAKRFLNTLSLRLQMAKSRGVDLKQLVLAKLMLLEYLSPEAFRILGDAQTAQEGRPRELAAAERVVRGEPAPKPSEAAGGKEKDKEAKVVAVAPPVDKIEPYLAGDWIRQWLKLDPELGGIDLRAYFYFSRDIFVLAGSAAQRMSPRAQQIYSMVAGKVDRDRTKALGEAPALSKVDAGAIFETLATDVRREEDHGEESALAKTVRFVGVRPELTQELLLLIDSLPASGIPPSMPNRLSALVNRDEARRELVRGLLKKWIDGRPETDRLARAAKSAFAKSAEW